MFHSLYENSNVTSIRYANKTEKASRAFKNGPQYKSCKGLGGSGSCNCMFYTRGNAKDYDGWEELGNKNWNWKNVLEFFKKSEDMRIFEFRKNSELHAVAGLLKVDAYDTQNPLPFAVLDAAKQFQFPFDTDLNSGNQNGFGKTSFTVFEGERMSPARAFLIPAKNRTNLHIIKNALVTKIKFENGTAVGVDIEIDNLNGKKSIVAARAKKEVIVSAGAIASAQLLQLSGIGNKTLLEAFKIPLVKNVSVGENLQSHVQVLLFFEYQRSSPNSPSNAAQDYFNYLMHKNGSLVDFGALNVHGYLNTTNSNDTYPNIQFGFSSFKKEDPLLRKILDNQMQMESQSLESIIQIQNEASIIMVSVILLQQTTPGNVKIDSLNSNDNPTINSGILESEKDVNTLLQGIKIIQKFMTVAKAFEKLEVKELRVENKECDKFPQDSDDYWECYIREFSTTIHDPVGTCKMGPESDPSAVVDSHLRVHGIKGLRVVDGSIMPKIVSGDTNAPLMMIGEKGADYIKEDWKEKVVESLVPQS